MVEDSSPLAFKLMASVSYKPEGAGADDQGPTNPSPIRRGSTIADRDVTAGGGGVLRCAWTSRA